MKIFRLNDDNKKLIEESLGIPFEELTTNTIEQSMEKCKKQKCDIKIPKQTCRNIYLELGCILNMKKINKYLSKL